MTDIPISRVFDAIQPRERECLPNPDCCSDCYTAWQAARDRADWRNLHRANDMAREIRRDQDAAS